MLGASGIFKEIRKLYEFNALKEATRRRSLAEAGKVEEQAKALKIRNLQATINILSKLGYTREEMKTLLGYAEDWIDVFDEFGEKKKIKNMSLSVLEKDDEDDGGVDA